MIFSIIGNGFNLYHILRTPSLRAIKNTMLTFLNIADLSTGTIAIPCMIATVLHQEKGTTCQVQGFIITYLNGVSLTMSAAISIDRCHAVTDPYTYLAHLQFLRYTIIIISIWIIPLPFAITPLLSLQAYGLGDYQLCNLCWLKLSSNNLNYLAVSALAAGISAVIIIIISCYTIIFCIAYSKNNATIAGYGSIKKSIRTTSLIVGTNMLSWLPLDIICSTSVIQYVTSGLEYSVNPQTEVIILLLPYCNVALNPFIYAGTNATLKKKYKQSAYSIYCWISSGLTSNSDNSQSLSTPSCRPKSLILKNTSKAYLSSRSRN